MRAYKIEAKDGEDVLAVRYAGTQSDAKKTRDQLVEKLGVKKSQVSIEDEEIPAPKPELLVFINKLSEKSDRKE